MVQKKKNSGVQLRTPKAKSKLGLSVPRIGMPHDDFVRSDSNRETELMSVLGMTSQTGTSDLSGRTDVTSQRDNNDLTSTSGQTASGSLTSLTESANLPEIVEYPEMPAIIESPDIPVIHDAPTSRPEYDRETTGTTHTSLSGQTSLFTSTPSSIFPAIPSDPLPGKSRTLYAVLHQLTHGAENPTPSVRMRRADLMRLAGIGSRNTFIANMKRLEAAGLVTQTVIVGEADGNEFHVAETLPTQSMTTLTGQTIHAGQTETSAESFDQLTESLIAAIASSGASPEALASALEQAARQLREGK